MRLGIDFGGTNIKVGVFSEDGKEVLFRQDKVQHLQVSENLLNDILSFIKKITSPFKLEKGGLAIKGLINKTTGVLEEDIGIANEFSGRNLIAVFQQSLNIPFTIENDARSYAWGEWLFGAGKGSKSMACLTLGTGLGSALVKDENVFEGADSLGGLLGGHISIDRFGDKCVCGNVGCLELYCSATAFKKEIIDHFPEFENSADILISYFSQIRNGRKELFPILEEFNNNLSIGITNVIHAYGPEIVVLGGGLLNSSDLIIPKVTELVKEKAWTVPRGYVKIKKSELGNRAATLGAAFQNI